MQCILKYRHCSINFTLSLSFSELKNLQKLQKAQKGRWDGETLFTKWPELKKKKERVSRTWWINRLGTHTSRADQGCK